MKACDISIAFFIHLSFSVCATVSDTPDANDVHCWTKVYCMDFHSHRSCTGGIHSFDIAGIYLPSIGKTELTPLFIPAGLGDIIVISAPVINNTDSIYYLSDPNGDNKKLNINTTKVTTGYKETSRTKNNYDYNNPNEGKVKTVIGTMKKRKIISLNYENYVDNCLSLYDDFVMEPNDFEVGPLSEDDHGNWVLSLYYKGINDGVWRELFQVITIHLVETLPTQAPKTKLVPGQTFEPRFLYPINNLQSCEISAPRTTFDRFYDRDRFNMDSCGFRIPNVTKDDEGVWTIFGVGKLVFKGEVYLKIDDEDL